MSYFVVKGPRDGRHYLGVLPGYDSPQWTDRARARHFPDAEGAWKWLEAVLREHGADYAARVARVDTVADLRAERARLIAEGNRLRGRLSELLAERALPASDLKLAFDRVFAIVGEEMRDAAEGSPASKAIGAVYRRLSDLRAKTPGAQ